MTKVGDNSPEFSAALQNMGRSVPTALKWIKEHGAQSDHRSSFRWEKDVAAAAEETFNVASQYSHFETCFPMWWRDRYAACLVSPDIIRFNVGTSRDHQVSAYLKGIRPNQGRFRGVRATKADMPLSVVAAFEITANAALMTDPTSFHYADPFTLWNELLLQYAERIEGIARRSDAISLGDYTLKEFKQFYAAFFSVSAAHEFLCFLWGKQTARVYPIGSAVIVRPRQQWIDLLSDLSKLPSKKCESTIDDLLFNASSFDLHINPLIPLDTDGSVIAIAPQFPLHSLPDENILRVCSYLRPKIFNANSSEGEPQTLKELQKRHPKRNPMGRFSMPDPIPDIDLLLADESCSTVVIGELKWVRKSALPREIPRKDEAVAQGIDQLKKIRNFLNENPRHLSAQRILPKPINEYQHVYYVLVPRDHFLWIEPADGIEFVEFEALSKALGGDDDLHSAVSNLFTYDWLPVYGRDFTIRYQPATVNGVSIQAQTFYSLEKQHSAS